MLQNMKARIQNIYRSVSNKIPKLMELYDLNGVIKAYPGDGGCCWCSKNSKVALEKF